MTICDRAAGRIRTVQTMRSGNDTMSQRCPARTLFRLNGVPYCVQATDRWTTLAVVDAADAVEACGGYRPASYEGATGHLSPRPARGPGPRPCPHKLKPRRSQCNPRAGPRG